MHDNMYPLDTTAGIPLLAPLGSPVSVRDVNNRYKRLARHFIKDIELPVWIDAIHCIYASKKPDSQYLPDVRADAQYFRFGSKVPT